LLLLTVASGCKYGLKIQKITKNEKTDVRKRVDNLSLASETIYQVGVYTPQSNPLFPPPLPLLPLSKLRPK
jgi:hypothetical protein